MRKARKESGVPNGTPEREGRDGKAQEARDALAMMREAVALFEKKASTLRPETVIRVVQRIVGAVYEEAPQRGQPKRGLGYSKDDAQIVASLPEHKNSLAKAIKAHFPGYGEDQIKVATKRIKRHMRAIQLAEKPDREKRRGGVTK